MKTDHPPADGAIDFDILIDPAGNIAAEHAEADAGAVREFLGRLDRRGSADTDAKATEAVREAIGVEEAAVLLDVDRNTLYEALGRGEGPPARRIGRVYRLARGAVLAWLRDGDVPRSRGRGGGR